jgi:ribokinase
MSVAIQQDDGDYAAIVVSGANRDIDAAHIAASGAAIDDSRVLVLQNEIAESANVAAADLARTGGTLVVLNAAPARPLTALQGLVDVLVVNAVEAEMLGAGRVDSLERAVSAAGALQGLVPTVIVTAGSHGVAAVFETGSLALPAFPVTTAETHGAGDVFVGALSTRLAGGTSMAEALGYANAAAALHVGSPEAERDGLGPADVERLIKSA